MLTIVLFSVFAVLTFAAALAVLVPIIDRHIARKHRLDVHLDLPVSEGEPE